MDQVEEIKNTSSETGRPEKSPESKEQGRAPEMQGIKDSVAPAVSVSDDTDVTAISSALSVKNQDGSTVKNQTSSKMLKTKKKSSAPYVKKAAKVIEDDKGDPYKEEEDLEDIQIEYLKDRFGKDLKKS